jgi:hypothetical protein
LNSYSIHRHWTKWHADRKELGFLASVLALGKLHFWVIRMYEICNLDELECWAPWISESMNATDPILSQTKLDSIKINFNSKLDMFLIPTFDLFISSTVMFEDLIFVELSVQFARVTGFKVMVPARVTVCKMFLLNIVSLIQLNFCSNFCPNFPVKRRILLI